MIQKDIVGFIKSFDLPIWLCTPPTFKQLVAR